MSPLKIGDHVVLKRRCHTGRTSSWKIEEFSGRSFKLRYPDGCFIWAARQEFKRVDPNNPRRVCLRSTLPYGMWTCADGREILFNRNYQPIWQRIDGVFTAADRDEWVPWVEQSWFFDDTDPPWLNAHTHVLCEAALAELECGLKVNGPWRYGVARDAVNGQTRVILPRTEPQGRRVGAR